MKGITLVNTSVSFPELMMPNDPKAFGLPKQVDGKTLKHIMTLGRIRLCPDTVLRKAAKGESLQESPVYKLRVIRSQLQGAVNMMTFPFMNGMCRALPDGALAKFRLIEKHLQQEFEKAANQLQAEWGTILQESLAYWDKHHAELLKGLSAKEVRNGITHVFNNPVKTKFNVAYFDVKAMDENTKIDATVDIIEAKKAVVAESAEKYKAEMQAFRKDMVDTLRAKFINIFKEAQEQIKSGKFNQKTFKAVIRQIEGFSMMNIMGDKALEAVLNEAKVWCENIKAKTLKQGGEITSTPLGAAVVKIAKLGPIEAAVQELVSGDGRVIEISEDDEPF